MGIEGDLDKYSFRKGYVVSVINSLSIRVTDCSFTFDSMMNNLEHATSLVRNLSGFEMFEVLLKLDESGIENMNRHLFREWDSSKVGVWDYRQIKNTLEHVTKNN